MFEPLKKVGFAESLAKLRFEAKRVKRVNLENDFEVAEGFALPKLYTTAGVSERKVFIDDYRNKSVFLELGRVIKKGISVSDGHVDVVVPEGLPDEFKAFLSYSTTVNVLKDVDNRHVRKIWDKKVSLTVNGKKYSSVVGKVYGLSSVIETLYDNLDKTMTSYFREQLGKTNVFSVKFLPVTGKLTGRELIGEGVLEVRFRAVDGSVYTRNYGVRYGLLLNVGDSIIEDENGEPVSVRKVSTASLVIGGGVLDSSSISGILRRYVHGTITVEAFMRVADPEFFVSTLSGSAYIEPSDFKVRVGELGVNFLVEFVKKHVHGSVGDFGVTDLVSEVKVGVRVVNNGKAVYPKFLLKTGERSHYIVSSVRKFLLSVLSSVVLYQRLLKFSYVRPKRHLLISGDSNVPEESTPLFVGNEPVGVMSVRGLAEYVKGDLPSDPEKYSKTPKSFPFKGVLHVGVPHKSKLGVVIPLMTPEEVEEGSRAYVYSLLVSGGNLIPIRLSMNVEAVEFSA